ncbi:MAG: hypothetical protein ACRCW1_03400 [Anaerotignaceae bacterium]
MLAKISKSDGTILIQKKIKNVNELDKFLMDNNLIRNFKDLREDIKWDSCTYFISLSYTNYKQR